ncbi:MAG TPA: GNAT family N-acetyltransferase [Hyphomicrobium sp.]|jgi:predicted N-acyltransferase|uniref:GNAT family N-acetyltransferase n=1 Tax=Hyphomicrobium sp. TaxID=82 RepID=UPI002C29B3FA|nr:GNAT family N-acetyltransferase [Hyphomicrobium sp.]HXE01000.1 GNAT family N-acetyltransferase [Hyphomicrobium sp.]
MSSSSDATVTLVPSIAEIDAAQWDACANPDPATFNPFVSHAFLKALETSRTVGRTTGWLPRHLVLEDENGKVAAAAPAYVKSHSQGEYVFDHTWAEAYVQAGGRYYPKLQIAVPFTPVPGPRLLVKPGPKAIADEELLASAAIEVARQGGLSSIHLTFLAADTATRLRTLGFLTRTGQQFHWQNRGYTSFDDFLATLTSRKRKAVRKEREAALAPGIEIEHLTGPAITEAHWDAMFAFYTDTGNRKWGRPYLNRAFFSELGRVMPDRSLLVMAKRDGRYIAGALDLIGGDCLYGRYWGAIEHHPALHFEVCYYQAIEFAIASGLARVEAGAQGEHKLARGYLPVETYSAHWIADPGLRRAVERFLMRESEMVTRFNADLTELGPYRKDEA